MKRAFPVIFLIILASCQHQSKTNSPERIITVSIAPFKYFVEQVGGDDFIVNVMVPPGSDPHIYEPVPEQIHRLRSSEAYLSNGFLGFEMVWLDRFFEVNPDMVRINLGEKIEPILTEDVHEAEHLEGADPHYWVSPVCAEKIAYSVRDLLSKLEPGKSQKYEDNCNNLVTRIRDIDAKARKMFFEYAGESFMIYHPNLAYLARDYGLREIAVESEGKEPSPADMKKLVDHARRENIKTIFVQKEYDRRNAGAIADEIGAELIIIDPLSEDWESSVNHIIDKLYQSLEPYDGMDI